MKDSLPQETKSRIREINLKYRKLFRLSNDEFRATAAKLMREIRMSKEKDILSCFLTDCFAVVKETCRRLSLGDVRVRANANDRRLAEQYDFVDIDGRDAIYHNKWEAGGVTITWNMIHYDTQIAAAIMIHEGYAVEMATGEGKTLAITMPAFLNAIQHRGVHIQTVNDYLSKRDCELTRPIYMMHGLSVDCIEYYDQDKIKTKQAYHSDICFGEVKRFVFDYLRDNLVQSMNDKVQGSHYFAIIDELDSVLIDSANTPNLISSVERETPVVEYMREIDPIVKEIMAFPDRDSYFFCDEEHGVIFSQKMIDWLRNEKGLDYFNHRINSNQNNKDNPVSNSDRNNYGILALNFLLIAYMSYKRDVNYMVDGTDIIIIDPNTGRPDYNSRWNFYLHNAVEVKENVPVKKERIASATISMRNYYKLYHKISGTSGTIEDVCDELLEQYGLPFVHIPTNRKCIRHDHPLKLYRNMDTKYKGLVAFVKTIHEKRRPVLVSCQSTYESEIVFGILEDNGIDARLLNAKNLQKEAFIISKAGEDGAITVSTAIAGRGTDIKLTDLSRDVGGLFVIGTSVFQSSRIDKQLMGRAGRQGDPGDSIFFASLEDDVMNNLTDEEKEKMKVDSRKHHTLDCKMMRKWVEKAQTSCDYNNFKNREQTRLQDEVLMPIRKQYYAERDIVIKYPKKAYEKIRKTAIKHNIIKEYNRHLEDIYDQVKTIALNAQRNNAMGYLPVIFSCDGNLYNLNFEVEQTLKSFDYFKEQFVQQIMLMVYDNDWADLINHVVKYYLLYSPQEIQKIYRRIRQEEEKLIIRTFFYSSIPVNRISASSSVLDGQSVSNHPSVSEIEDTDYIRPIDPCPCGSGKNYGECHGKRLLPPYHSRKR